MYIEYKPLSQKNDNSTFVPPELFEAQCHAINNLPKDFTKDFDSWVADKLNTTKEELWESFSSEQIDSIGLCIYNFENGKNFIIGDETGIGKGRILGGISLYAWNNDLKVLFFTEREHLISEFWKDLIDIDAVKKIINPTIFHSNSKVYDKDSNIVIKGTAKQVKNIEENGFPEDTNLVLTNYSQISLKQHKKTKTEPLLKYCEKAIVILDESHNATGDSNTKKLLLKLVEEAKNVVFSSATYIKDETQLDLYQNSFSFDEGTIALFKKLLKNDHKGTLRKLFTYELTKNLQFWRREHEPLNVGWNTLVCSDEEYNNKILQEYSEVINGLFKIVSDLNKNPDIENQIVASSWFTLGATINRLSRNLLLVLKLKTLVNGVKKSIEENHKAVIVIDSTLSSMVKKIHTKDLNLQKESEVENEGDIDLKNDYALNFKDAVNYIIDEVLGEYLESGSVEPNVFIQYQKLKEKTLIFEGLSISPIDTIIDGLANVGVSCKEISGRNTKLTPDGKIQKIIKEPKTKIVKEFNDGLLDSLIITRAGASGISLHASAVFKDQKVRDLYELEITNRPTYRLQFIGRVNRKNQVAQPRFFTVVTNLPFEQRILNIEQRKLKTLQSHISGDDEKLNQENVVNFYNKHTDNSAKIFLKHHPHLAYQMGINLKTAKDDFYYIDSILKRCIVLSVEQQNKLYDYLLFSVEAHNKLSLRKNIPEKIESEWIKTFWHKLDNIEKDKFKEMFGLFPNLSINQFIFPWVGLMKTKSTYNVEAQFHLNLSSELEKNKTKDETIKNHLNKMLDNINSKNKYQYDFFNRTVAPIIQSIGIGKCVKINGNDGKIYGYIHDIIYPNISGSWKYDNLTLIQIKTIDPHLHESIHYANSDYYLTIEEFVESKQIEFTNTEINWSQFTRNNKPIERYNYCFVGHPVYMQFMQQAYGFGEVEYYKFYDKNHMCIVLPSQMSESDILTLKKPIYRANGIMDGLISKKIGSLTTSWQDENEVKPIFKLEPTSGGYHFLVAQEVSRNFEIIDFPLRKRLGNNMGKLQGYLVYHIPYKDVRGLLWMLEQRDVVWFINPKR